MSIDIKIDKDSNTPIYLQIIEQITLMVKNGVIKVGDRLPPERELANKIGIARGTIKNAYKELERNKIIEVIQGRGTYISRIQDILEVGKKENAIAVINEMLSKLESMNFSQREISTLVNILINDRENKYKKIQIAAIDCNPEALYIYERQLGYISNVKIHKFLLGDICKTKSFESILDICDIIITTSTHLDELVASIPKYKDKIIQIVVSPSQQTIIDIASIDKTSFVGVICSSQKFFDIITESLISAKINLKNMSHIFNEENADIAIFVKSKKYLIIPPVTLFETEDRNIFDEFQKSGGRIITFDYQIERGSLIYLEEQIANRGRFCI